MFSFNSIPNQFSQVVVPVTLPPAVHMSSSCSIFCDFVRVIISHSGFNFAVLSWGIILSIFSHAYGHLDILPTPAVNKFKISGPDKLPVRVMPADRHDVRTRGSSLRNQGKKESCLRLRTGKVLPSFHLSRYWLVSPAQWNCLDRMNTMYILILLIYKSFIPSEQLQKIEVSLLKMLI